MYSINGDIVNQFGVIDNKNYNLGSLLRFEGIPFALINGNYGIVLMNSGLINIYSPNGLLLNEEKLQDIFAEEMPKLRDLYSKVADYPNSKLITFYDILSLNNKLFMLKSGITDDSKADFNVGIIYVVDEEFNLTKKISFKFPFNIEPPRGRVRYNNIINSTFDVAEKGNKIFLPIQDFATVCVFKIK